MTAFLEAPGTRRGPGRPRKAPAAAGRRKGARRGSGKKALRLAKKLSPNQIVEYRQGRGTFEAKVVALDAETGMVTVERVSDGKKVVRPATKIITIAKGNGAAKAPAVKVKAKAKKAKRATVKHSAKPAAKAANRGAGLMKPQQPDDVLAAIVGTRPLPRGEVVKRLWVYIKKNDLQDAKNKRMINADDKLAKVFGGKKQVVMFEMLKLMGKHLG